MDLTGKKIAILVDQQYQELEVWYPYYRFVEAGAKVDLVGPEGVVVARGVVNYDAAELPAIIGRRSADLPRAYRREIVHADDLVPL